MIKGEAFDISFPETFNLGGFFLDGNLEAGRGDKVAIHYKERSLTFLELWRMTNRVGNLLRGLGVEPGNRVLLVLGDSPEWVATWLGCMKIGGVGAHAYTYLQTPDYEHLLQLVRPKVVVATPESLDRVREAASGLRYPKAILVAGENEVALREGEYSLSALIAAASDELTPEPTHREDLAFWNFSGGTTGKPKGVPHMHRDGAISYMSFDYILGFEPDDIVLRVPKMFFHYSRDLGALFPLRSGATLVLFEERTTKELLFDLIERYRPTILCNVPTMMRTMLQTPAAERPDFSCIRRSYSSGEALSAQLYNEWAATFGHDVVNRFGSAESAMAYLGNREGAVMPGSSGTVTPFSWVKLVDGDGVEVARGEPGKLLARCPSAGRYYEREHDKSVETFLGDYWVDTGDLFTQDENDYFWYAGRANEMVKVSGVWVSPLEIERGLNTHPDVKEAVAMGLPDADGLIKIKAFVVLEGAADNTEAMPDILKRHCKESLAPHKFPTAIEFMDDLPKTGQGKIDKRLLRDQTT